MPLSGLPLSGRPACNVFLFFRDPRAYKAHHIRIRVDTLGIIKEFSGLCELTLRRRGGSQLRIAADDLFDTLFSLLVARVQCLHLPQAFQGIIPFGTDQTQCSDIFFCLRQ